MHQYSYFDRIEQPVNWTSPASQMGLTAQEPFSGWTTPAVHAGFTPHGHNGNSMPPVNLPRLPEHPGFAPQGQPTPWAQRISHAWMIEQGQPLGWAPLAGHAGMFAQGHPAALLPPSANPFGFSASGQQANWGGFGNPTGWGGQVNPMGWGGPWAPMGWGNNQGKGQPGILGGLLKVGTGTMGGIGIINNLIGVGKFLF